MAHGPRLALAVVAVVACSDEPPPPATVDPGVVYTFPLDAQLDVPLGAPVIVSFSDPVDQSALGACSGTATEVTGAFCLVGPAGPVDAMPEVVGDGKTVRFNRVGLDPGTTYAVYVRSALAATAKNLPDTGPLFQFTTRSQQPRAAAPTLVAVNGGPVTEPEAFRPLFESSTLRLLFSEPLDPRTVVLGPGGVELVDMATSSAVPATLLARGVHVSVDPLADLVPGTSYELRVGGQLADLGGERLAPVVVALTPKDTGADQPIPELLRTREPGDSGPATSHASPDLNLISIDNPLIGSETAQMLPSVLAVDMGDPLALGGPLTFTIRRGQRLRTSGLDVKLGGELPLGLSTGEIEIEFLSDAAGRIFRNPYQPAGQRPDNDRSPLFIDLAMDLAVYAVDPTGNAVLSQTVLGVQASGPVVATQGVLDIQTVVAMDLELLGVTRAPTNLVMELITDNAAQRSVDQTAPTLVGSMPSGSGGELPVDAGLELLFSEPVDLDRARAGGLRLETVGGQPVPTVIESHGAALVLRPTAPLAYATTYRVAMSDIADMAGNQLTDAPVMNVSTPPLQGTSVPLAVASTHPGVPCTLTAAGAGTPGRCSSGEAGDDRYHPFSLAANEPVHVTFTQPVAPASITHATACNAGSVRIEELDAAGACVRAVPGTLMHHDRALSFVPDAPWELEKRYRLTLVSGGNASCAAGEVCGLTGVAASFDPLAGVTNDDAGGPNLALDFTGAPATDATLFLKSTGPFTDINGSGRVDGGERARHENRVALRITGTSGVVSSASFPTDCLPSSPEREACMYLSGVMPVELLPVAHDCKLPDGSTAATCVPVVLSPQAMYATSIDMDATVAGIAPISTATGMSVMRIREPANGPITGYLIDDAGTPTLVLSLELYLDAPDLSVPLSSHDLLSKPLSVALRGPMRFLPDGRIAIAVTNVADVPVNVNITAPLGITGTIRMVVPRGEMKIQLVSAPLRGGLP